MLLTIVVISPKKNVFILLSDSFLLYKHKRHIFQQSSFYKCHINILKPFVNGQKQKKWFNHHKQYSAEDPQMVSSQYSVCEGVGIFTSKSHEKDLCIDWANNLRQTLSRHISNLAYVPNPIYQ
jgi:hypothetical protein